MLNTVTKRRVFFYMTLDPQRKKLFGKHFCYSIIARKKYPELENDEILMQVNRFDTSKLNDVIEGKFYRKDAIKVFGENFLDNKTNLKQKYFDNNYNPYEKLEKRDIEDIHDEKLNIYKYFDVFNNFIGGFNKSESDENKNKLTKAKNQVDTFIKSLCKIYIGHNIHQRIYDEISKKTNLLILKGDYFSSLGYYSVSKLGNPLIVRFYSKIAENFARSIFSTTNMNDSKDNLLDKSLPYETQYMNHLVKKFIGFIYYGCCGIKELNQNIIISEFNDLIKEFSFKYGFLIYLREEMAFLNNKSYEYYSKVEDLNNIFLFYSEKIFKELLNSSNEDVLQKIDNFRKNKLQMNKYKYLAANLCGDLMDLIDTLGAYSQVNEGHSKFEEMKTTLRLVCLDLENLTKC